MGIEDRDVGAGQAAQAAKGGSGGLPAPHRPPPRPLPTSGSGGGSGDRFGGSDTAASSNYDYYTDTPYSQAVAEGRTNDWMSGFRSSGLYVGPSSNRFDSPSGWTTMDKGGWYEIQQWAKATYGFSVQAQYQTRVNRAAQEFYQREGRWPSALELQNDPTLNQYLYSSAMGFNQLPATFAVDGEAYYNDPWRGPQSLRGNVNELGPGAIDAMLNDGTLNNSGQVVQPQVSWTRDEFMSVIGSLGSARGGGSGGGGGGGGRTPVAWDRDDLIEQANDRWRGLMLEDPGADIEKLVDDYINKANSFWMSEGGRLEFDTFIVNKARDTGRYKQLYSRLPQHMTEEEYIAGFRQTAERFGLNQSATRRETVAGAQAGVGLAGFSDRVSRTREARNANTGGFSQQLAATFKSMPGLAGS